MYVTLCVCMCKSEYGDVAGFTQSSIITFTDMDGPGAPGAAVPSSPGGSGSRILDSSSASAFSASPPPSAAHPSEAHLEAHHTLSPAGRRQAPDRVDNMNHFLNPMVIFHIFLF